MSFYVVVSSTFLSHGCTFLSCQMLQNNSSQWFLFNFVVVLLFLLSALCICWRVSTSAVAQITLPVSTYSPSPKGCHVQFLSSIFLHSQTYLHCSGKAPEGGYPILATLWLSDCLLLNRVFHFTWIVEFTQIFHCKLVMLVSLYRCV